MEGCLYKLIIDNLNKEQKKLLQRWNSVDRKYEPILYEIGRADHDIVEVKGPPVFIRDTYIRLGCGPESNLIFRFDVKDQTEIWIETEVKNLKTEIINKYILVLGPTMELKVGREMCSGAFIYDSSAKYQIRFKIKDSSGNTDGQWTSNIIVNAPKKRLI